MATSESNALEQVRDILVGAMQREMERRVSHLESRITLRCNEIQQETKRRTDVIESHLQKETDNLSARLDGELVGIREALRGLTRENRETASAMEQRLAKIDETLARAQHDMRQEILQQAKSFMDELHQVREELTDTLNRELGAEYSEAASGEESTTHDLREAG